MQSRIDSEKASVKFDFDKLKWDVNKDVLGQKAEWVSAISRETAMAKDLLMDSLK